MDFPDLINTIASVGKSVGVFSDKDISHDTGSGILRAYNEPLRNSIKNAAKDLIAQYPVLFTNDISSESISLMNRVFEHEYVNILALIINNDNITTAHKTSDIISKYHQNINFNDRYYNDFTESVFIDINKELLVPYVESISLTPINDYSYTQLIEGIINESVISKTEIKDTIKLLYEKLQRLNDREKEIRDEMQDIKNNYNNHPNPKTSLDLLTRELNQITKDIGQTLSQIKDLEEKLKRIKYDEEKKRLEKEQHRIDKENDKLDKRNKVMVSKTETSITSYDLKKINEMVPTIVNVDVTMVIDRTTVTKRIQFGVKCIAHLLETSDAEYYIPSITTKSNALFKLIQWTSGEIKFFKDLILCVDSAKKDAKSSKGKSNFWWVKLKSMSDQAKTKGILRVFFKNPSIKAPIPTATMILSKNLVDTIKNKNGINLLSNPRFAALIMRQLFLLNFAIIDESIETLYLYDDKNGDYNIYNFSDLEKQTRNKKLDIKDIYNIFK